MANNSTPDVYLLLGVEGGSNIGKGSGLLISTQLKQIMEQVEETITSHLKIKLDQNALNDLKTQINSTVTEALTSIKGTPVELSFSFDQKSIDAAFSKVKKEMKEQQITVSALPKEKKETGKSGTPVSHGNISKEATEVKQEINAVGQEIENVAKEAEQALDSTIKKAEEAAKAVAQAVQKTIKLDTRTLGLQEQEDVPLDYMSAFLKTRRSPKSKQDDYIVSVNDFAKYMNKNHTDDYGWFAYSNEGGDNYSEQVTDWMRKEYANYTQLFEFIENKDKQITGIRIKNQEELNNIIEYQHKRQKEAYDQQEAYNESIETAVKHLNIKANDGYYEVTSSQLQDLESKFPGIVEKLSHSQIHSQDLSAFLKETEVALNSVEKNVDDITNSEKEAAKAFDIQDYEHFPKSAESFKQGGDIIIRTYQDMQRALEEYKKSFHIEDNQYFPSSVDSFRPSSTVNPITSLPQLQETTKALSQNVTPVLMLPEVSTVTKQMQEASQVVDVLRNKMQGLGAADDDVDIAENIKEDIDALGEETNAVKGTTDAYEELESAIAEVVEGRRSLSTSTTTFNDQITSISENIINDETGKRSRITANLTRDKEGNVSINTTEIESNQKAVAVIDKLNGRIEKLRDNLIKLDKTDTQDIAKSARENIDRDINSAEQLLNILTKIANGVDITGDEHSLLNKFGISDISSFTQGAERIDSVLTYINDKMREANQAVAENERGWDRAANSVKRIQDGFLEIDRSFDKLKESDKNNVASELREDIEIAIGDAKELANALTLAANGDDSALKKLDINTFDEGYDKLKLSILDINDKMREANQAVANYDRSLNNLAQTQARVAEYTKEFTNLSSMQYSTSSPAYQALVNQQNLISKLSQVVAKGKDSFNASELDISGINTYEQAVQMLTSELNKAEAALKEFKSTASNITDDTARLKLEEYTRVLNDLRNAPGGVGYAKAIESSIIPSDLQNDVQILQYVKEHYNEITEAIRSATNETARLNKQHREEENVMTQRNKIYQEADNYYKKYQSGIQANVALNQKWLDLMEDINTGGFGTDNESARRALAELQTETKEANAETMTLWGSLKKLFTDHFGAVSATAFIGSLRNVLQGAYQNVLQIDKAITELKKVTDLTERQYKEFMGTAAELATKVGSSVADAIRSTADFARLGFSVEQSTALSEAAMVYKNVGDGLDDINEASESIISTIKAFSDIDAKDAMSIIDKFNEVGEISVELPTPRLIQNKWLITISVKVQRWIRPRKECYIM